MLREIAYHQIGPFPTVAIVGMVTLLSFLFTASIAILNKRGIHKIPFFWHPRMAKISIALAFVHAILAISVYL